MIESATERAPRRRWYQFSLRTLLVGMLIMCLAACWVGWRMKRARENRERINGVQQDIVWIEEVGGGHDAESRNLRSRDWLEQLFNDPGGTDDPADEIIVSRVQLGLGPAADSLGPRPPGGKRDQPEVFTDAGLSHLKSLTNLQELWLFNRQVTDAGLEHLKDLNRLELLNLIRTQVTDEGLVNLKDLVHLKTLELSYTQVTDMGLVNLKGLRNLESLGLTNTQITDVGLKHLKGMTKLEVLSLDHTQITDAGLEHLKGLTNLEKLWLEDTNVTDAGLTHLKGLTKLDWIDLYGTQVTADGAADLRLALPNCNVHHPGR